MSWLEFWGWLGAFVFVLGVLGVICWILRNTGDSKGWRDNGEGE